MMIYLRKLMKVATVISLLSLLLINLTYAAGVSVSYHNGSTFVNLTATTSQLIAASSQVSDSDSGTVNNTPFNAEKNGVTHKYEFSAITKNNVNVHVLSRKDESGCLIVNNAWTFSLADSAANNAIAIGNIILASKNVMIAQTNDNETGKFEYYINMSGKVSGSGETNNIIYKPVTDALLRFINGGSFQSFGSDLVSIGSNAPDSFSQWFDDKYLYEPSSNCLIIDVDALCNNHSFTGALHALKSTSDNSQGDYFNTLAVSNTTNFSEYFGTYLQLIPGNEFAPDENIDITEISQHAKTPVKGLSSIITLGVIEADSIRPIDGYVDVYYRTAKYRRDNKKLVPERNNNLKAIDLEALDDLSGELWLPILWDKSQGENGQFVYAFFTPDHENLQNATIIDIGLNGTIRDVSSRNSGIIDDLIKIGLEDDYWNEDQNGFISILYGLFFIIVPIVILLRGSILISISFFGFSKFSNRILDKVTIVLTLGCRNFESLVYGGYIKEFIFHVIIFILLLNANIFKILRFASQFILQFFN